MCSIALHSLILPSAADGVGRKKPAKALMTVNRNIQAITAPQTSWVVKMSRALFILSSVHGGIFVLGKAHNALYNVYQKFSRCCPLNSCSVGLTHDSPFKEDCREFPLCASLLQATDAVVSFGFVPAGYYLKLLNTLDLSIRKPLVMVTLPASLRTCLVISPTLACSG